MWVPLHHPCYFQIVHSKPSSYLGYPHDLGNLQLDHMIYRFGFDTTMTDIDPVIGISIIVIINQHIIKTTFFLTYSSPLSFPKYPQIIIDITITNHCSGSLLLIIIITHGY